MMIGGKLKCEVYEVAGIEPAIWGMRNPMNSHYLSDTIYEVGERDLTLAKKLVKAGTEHRKFLRQIQVWLDLTTTRFHWQELDTYKFGTKNSESTIHTIHKQPVTMDNFYIGDDPIIMVANHLETQVIPMLNKLRELYLETKDYRWVKEMKRVLPESFLQRRTWNTNYEELANIYTQRRYHKLNEEWGILLREIEKLPYFKEMILDSLSE